MTTKLNSHGVRARARKAAVIWYALQPVVAGVTERDLHRLLTGARYTWWCAVADAAGVRRPSIDTIARVVRLACEAPRFATITEAA